MENLQIAENAKIEEKKIIASKEKNAKKENLNLEKKEGLKEINLSKFSKSLESIQIKEKKEKGESNLYRIPEEIKKLSYLQKSEEMKKFRGLMRRKRDGIFNNILFFAKGRKIEELKKEIAIFEKFYKENYLINDFSIFSISNKEDSSLSLGLEIIKEFKGIKK
jgi:hypothetical protein